MFCNMFVLVTDYTLRNIMSANDQGIVAVTGRAHCQRQVAFFYSIGPKIGTSVAPPSEKSTEHGLSSPMWEDHSTKAARLSVYHRNLGANLEVTHDNIFNFQSTVNSPETIVTELLLAESIGHIIMHFWQKLPFSACRQTPPPG